MCLMSSFPDGSESCCALKVLLDNSPWSQFLTTFSIFVRRGGNIEFTFHQPCIFDGFLP